jgi:hypothetical protein
LNGHDKIALGIADKATTSTTIATISDETVGKI